MIPLRPGIRRLFRLDDPSRDLRDEMELHIALRAEQLVRSGLTADEALHEARRLFAQGDHTIGELQSAAFERSNRMHARERWDAIWHDIRYAFRRLRREPAVSAFMVVTLALGIGINVTAFSIVDRVLLRGPQFVSDPHRLIRLYSRTTQPSLGPRTMPWLPYPSFVTLREQMHTVDAIGAYRVDDAMLGSGATSEAGRVSSMSSEMFGLLGVHPVSGRFYSASEDAENVAVISERYWRAALGSDPQIVGKGIAINDVSHTVIGIAPAGFTGVELKRVDVWTPIKIAQRNSQNIEIVARLKPGVAIDAAMRDVTQHRPQIEATLPRFSGWLRGAEYLAAPIAFDDTARESFESQMARWLAAISAVILLASCANVANLLLARLARRRRELAVRVALGSGRARVVRLLMLEGLLLALGAALLAVAVILLVEPVVQQALFPGGSWSFSLLDPRIIASVAVITIVTGMLVSIVPAMQAGRRDVTEMLHGGNRSGEARSMLRSSLTVVQAMLSVVLLVGAGLFLRSLARVNDVDLGMQPDRVLVVEPRYPRPPIVAGEPFAERLARLNASEQLQFTKLADAVRRVPGVETAAVSIGVPFYETFSNSVFVPGRDSIPALPGGGPYATAAGENYFATIGTAMRRGRGFSASDHAGSEPVVIVSETMARTLWPGADALTKCVQIGSREATCARVVGVAADLHHSGLKEEPSLQYYVPLGQERGFGGTTLLVRTPGNASGSWPQLREAIHHADPTIQSINVRSLAAGLDGEMRPLRLGTLAFGLSAVLALIVAGLGLFSIMAHSVAWRRHEIGVRLALGARPSSIAMLIVGRGTLLASIGIGLGLLVAVSAGRWIEPVLFNTSARDPLVLIGVAGVLECLAVIAGWLPAKRAVAVSPTEALRAE